MSDIKNATEMDDFHPAPRAPVADPGALGLCAFALTTFMSSLFSLGVGVPAGSPPGILTGVAFFYGGLIQLLAGMWEFKIGNTFSATANASYGAFWLSYGSFSIPFFNNVAAYATLPPNSFQNAVGIFLLGWCIFSIILLPAAIHHSISYGALIFSVVMTFLFQAIGNLAHLEHGGIPVKIGAVFGLLISFLGWYNAAAKLYNVPGSNIHIPVGHRHGSSK